MKARGLPHIWQRRMIRLENLGGRLAFPTSAFFALDTSP